MKDWIRSPSPNPDEEAERQRRYDELLAQSSVGKSAHASSSKLPITTPSPTSPPPFAVSISPSQPQPVHDGTTRDADVCTPKIKRSRNVGGSEDPPEQPHRPPGTRVIRSPGSTVAKSQVTVVRAHPRPEESGSSRSQAAKGSNATSQTAAASVLGVASSPKSDPMRRSNPPASLPPRRGKLMSLADMCFRSE